MGNLFRRTTLPQVELRKV